MRGELVEEQPSHVAVQAAAPTTRPPASMRARCPGRAVPTCSQPAAWSALEGHSLDDEFPIRLDELSELLGEAGVRFLVIGSTGPHGIPVPALDDLIALKKCRLPHARDEEDLAFLAVRRVLHAAGL